jgi:PBP1b-binding outer membrane lipoprotein LpoB
MKKIIGIISIAMLLASCTTSVSEDTEMLQKKYPKSIVYRLNSTRYIIVDSTNVLDIRVTELGNIKSRIIIK